MKKVVKNAPVKQNDLYMLFVTETPVNGDPFYKLVAAHESLEVVKYLLTQLKVPGEIFHYQLFDSSQL